MLKQVLSALVLSSVVVGGAALAAEPATEAGGQASKSSAVTASVNHSATTGTHAKKHARTVHKVSASDKDMQATGTAPTGGSTGASGAANGK